VDSVHVDGTENKPALSRITPTEPAARPTRSRQRWTVLATVTVAVIGASMLQQALASLGPLVLDDLKLTRASFGLLASSVVGGMFVSTFPVGFLVDRYGDRTVVSIGLAGMAVMCAAAALMPSYPMMLAFFLASSVGAATSAPGAAKAIATWFEAGERDLAIGIRQSGGPIGALLAALALPLIGVYLGWRMAVVAASLFCLLGVAGFAAATRGGVAQKARVSTAVIEPGPITSRHFVAASIFGLVLTSVSSAAASYLSLYMHETARLTVLQAGWMLAMFQAGSIAGRIVWGAMTDRLKRRDVPMLLVVLLSSIACIAMTGVVGIGAVRAAALAFFLGFALNGWTGLYISMLLEVGGLDRAATRIGASLTIMLSGAIWAPPVFGIIVDRSSYAVAWLVLSIWIWFAALALLLARQPKATAQTTS
jgi:sugar phosphate permease